MGAGDNFNAGVVYGIMRDAIVRDDISLLSAEKWNRVIKCGLDFSAHACTLVDNYIEKSWAQEYKNI